MADTTPQAKGGQGVVIVGTLSRPGAPRIMVPNKYEKLFFKVFETILCDKSKEFHIEALEEAFATIADKVVSEALRRLRSESLKQDVSGNLKEPVFEAFKELFAGKKVAVKVLEWPRNDPEESARFFKYFVNELSLMASLSHPNIIQFIGFVEDMKKGDAWIILPWEANGNVREFLKSGRWEIPERISLIQDTANGLEYLHSHDPPICHGDLKSLNILVNSSYRAVITDFGSARIKRCAGSEEEDTRSETPLPVLTNIDLAAKSTSPQVKFDASTMDLTLTGPAFSLRWTAPEVLKSGMQELPSDMWAMGWICWEIITGKVPFEELHRDPLIIKHTIEGKLPTIREDSQLSHVLMLCGLMSDCWLSDPGKRIRAPVFQRKVVILPSETPSGTAVDGQKRQSAALLVELGRMHEFRSDRGKAEVHYLSAIGIATQTNDDLAKADALQCLGRIHGANSAFGEAEHSYKQALDICRHGGNSLGTANALGGLGEIYRMQSKYTEAENAFNRSRETYSRIGNDLGTGNALFGLGNTYQAQSKNREAEKAFNDAREIHSRIGNDLGSGNALLGLGNTYLAHSMNPEAEQAFIEAHEIHSRIGNDLGTASALDGLGQAHSAQSQNQEAERAFNEACEIHSRINDDSGIGNALVGLGGIYLAQSRTREAETAFIKAGEIYSRIGNDLGTANALDGLGDLYRLQYKNEDAQKAFNDALETHSRIGNSLGIGNALLGLGNTYLAQSMNSEAEEAFMEAHEIHSRIGNDLGTASALDGLGQARQAQLRDREATNAPNDARTLMRDMLGAGNGFPRPRINFSDQCAYNEAELYYRQVPASHDPGHHGHSSTRIPLVFRKRHYIRHRYLETEEAITKSLAAATNIAHQQGQAATSQFFAKVLGMQSERCEEMDALIQAEAVYTRIGNYTARARTWYLIGEVHLAQGMYAEAEESYQLAQAIYISINNNRGAATALLQFGRACIYQGRNAEAEESYRQARLLYAVAPDEYGEATALDGLAMAHILQGQFGDAKVAFLEACGIYARVGQPMSEVATHISGILQVVEDNPI